MISVPLFVFGEPKGWPGFETRHRRVHERHVVVALWERVIPLSFQKKTNEMNLMVSAHLIS
jgi:hypothetical protein